MEDKYDYSWKMDESLLINKNSFNGSRRLIASVLNQALLDVNNPNKKKYYKTARAFIRSKNKLFCFYCKSLDLDPQIVEKKMKCLYREKLKNYYQIEILKKYFLIKLNMLNLIKIKKIKKRKNKLG